MAGDLVVGPAPREWPEGLYKYERRYYPGEMSRASSVDMSQVETEPEFLGFGQIFNASGKHESTCTRCDKQTKRGQRLRYLRYRNAPDELVHVKCIPLAEWLDVVGSGKVRPV